jgi:hypothetical protein
MLRSISFVKQDLTTEINSICEKSILAFPNPANDFVTFSNMNEDCCQLSIYNTNGSLVYHKKAGSREVAGIGKWSPGIYFYSVSNPSGKIIYANKFDVIH